MLRSKASLRKRRCKREWKKNRKSSSKAARKFTRSCEFDNLDSLMNTKIYRDPVVEAYLPGVDRTLLRENLKLTPAQRLVKLVSFSSFATTLRRAGQRALRAKKR